MTLRTIRRCNRAVTLATALLSGGMLGCGSSTNGPERAAVAGKLTVAGKPVPGVEVHFLNPEYPDHGGFGMTQEDGSFRLVQGAVPGQNTVFFSKIEAEGIQSDPESGMDAGQFEAQAMAEQHYRSKNAVQIEEVIPQEFNNANSKLTFEVPESGTSSAVFTL